MFYVYILKSEKSGKYYVGSTKNLEERIKLHNGKKVQSTKSDAPWRFVYSEPFKILKDSRKRELQIKHWKSREAIEKLFRTFSI